MHTRTIGVALAVACALTLAGCSDDSGNDKAGPTTPQGQAPFDTAPVAPPVAATTAPPADPTGKLGTALALHNTGGGPLEVTALELVETQPASKETAPKAGMRLVAIKWRVTNRDTRAIQDTASMAVLIDDAGQSRSQHYGSVTAGEDIPSGVTIVPGASREGWHSYEVPVGAKVVSVRLDTGGALTLVTGVWTV